MDFISILQDIFGIFGYLIRIVGFLIVGLGLARFFLDAYPKANWQLQMALALGFFGLLIALTVFSTAGSAGAFALGAGIAFFMAKKETKDNDAKLEDTKKND
jgi:hypothetical protein